MMMYVMVVWGLLFVVLVVNLIRQGIRVRTLQLEVERLSRLDPLTKLLNRLALDRTLEKEVERAGRSGKYPSLILMDVDGFKEINDQQGRAMGNDVLERVAAAIRSAVRFEIDAPSRYGNDEFAILLPETSSAQAVKVADRIQETLKPREISLAVGVVECQPGWSSEVFLHHVDRELSRRRSEPRARSGK